MMKNTPPKAPETVEALPDDFDPMDMAAFLDGESNQALVKGLTESPALRAVAAAGLDSGQVADVDAAQALADRAAPLARRTATPAATGISLLERVSSWLGADWRGVAAGVTFGVFGLGAGLAGGLSLGNTGFSADDILLSASAADVFAFDTVNPSATDDATLYATDAFEAVFGSL